ncbi:MAG: DegT/DnrJ/EryC1/StrS family aminotransferase, partial [Deltaproteobacteria bacterium]|nr:DegT/DnrJ/EryC1/StrS family aminotransferase [Deltaproteobacteria bacterium]
GNELQGALLEAFYSGAYILGPQVGAFEIEFARSVNSNFAVGVASGSDALELSLKALKIGSGDEVITTPLSYIATSHAIEHVGAKIVFADIDIHTLTLDPTKVIQKISKKTKAIIPVHIFGQPCNMTEFASIKKAHALSLIEDAAQAVGSHWNREPLGSHSDSVCYSFFPTKNLGGCGDAGAITTNDPHIAESLSSLRRHGQRNEKYVHFELGRNSRLDTIQAAVLLKKISHLPRWNERRRELAHTYQEKLSHCTQLQLMQTHPLAYHVYHAFCIRAHRRNELKQHLSSKGIETAIYYPIPLHLQPIYSNLGYRKGDFPNAETVCDDILALPIHPYLTSDKIDFVCQSILEFFN